ncbi:acetoacetyl-CoA synthase-like protein [Cadophora sp. MPI-SDFR-AT-0126]|nr:acetoacetyl-CoA synthase-like protein [Leotiomycetes sp. MPI-SDFR-AT-0126]
MTQIQTNGTNGISKSSKPKLWTHPDPDSTRMFEFMRGVNLKYQLSLKTYEDLYRWSVGNIDHFWGEVWDFTGITAEEPYSEVISKGARMFPRPDFFAGSRLNFAENLLYPTNITVDENSPAIIEATETGHTSITWAQLRERVRQCTIALRSQGVVESDRVAGFLGNHANAVVAMLATASIGAIWTGVSPDTGVTAVLERLVQIEPKVLFVDNAVGYNGKVHGSYAKVKDILEGLKGLKACVIFETVKGHEMRTDGLSLPSGKVCKYADFVKSAGNTSAPLIFNQLPASHPLYILYSSGTTGAPKCIVHSAAGTLIQHKKEHILHCDIRPGDRMLYFTTTTWMMWHWLVSSLASGATIILYDGSPFHPHGPLSMPRLIQDLRITQFGTSAKYLSILEQKGIKPMTGVNALDLSSLKAIYSTGSPLAPSTFNYVYEAFPPTINLGSITGGTDIISLFGAPCPLLPVYSGEIQCSGLGMAIEAWSPSGSPIPDGSEGDLVCTLPFPCQPVTFFHATSPSQGLDKYRSAYFEQFPGVWHHGDFVRFEAGTRGLTMLGRSDGILKPSGVRFGSAEIYNVLLKWFGEEVSDAICVGRRREGEGDEVVVLFLKMEEGRVCDEGLKVRIKSVIRKELSARHVPGVIDECFDIPITGNGKKVEIAVKQILCGMNIKVGASVANKECLEWYREWSASN